MQTFGNIEQFLYDPSKITHCNKIICKRDTTGFKKIEIQSFKEIFNSFLLMALQKYSNTSKTCVCKR